MARLIKYLFLFVIISFTTFSKVELCAQNNKIDSLLILLKIDKEDTNKVNHLNLLSSELMYSNPDTAIILSNQGLSLAQKVGWEKGKANSLNLLGTCNRLVGNYFEALDFYFKGLKISEMRGDKQRTAIYLSNIGVVYAEQGDYSNALGYFFKALKISEELNDKDGIASRLGNIGLVYDTQADYSKALEYYFKALKIDEELGNKDGIARHLGNIGLVYDSKGNNSKALDYYFKALEIDEELANKNGITRHLSNIGLVYSKQSDYLKALDYYFKALKIDEEVNNKRGIAVRFCNIGLVYMEQKKYDEAEDYLLKGLKIVRDIKAFYEEERAEFTLSDLYEKMGNHKLALDHYKKAMALKNSIFSDEKNQEITRKEMNYEFEKKEAAAKADQDKKDAVTKIIIYSVSGGLVLVLFLAVFIFRGYLQKQKANAIITEQKLLVEEKQRDILDSIHYAKRIQTSLLPTEKYIYKTIIRLKRK